MIFTTQSGQSVGPIGQGTWYLGEDPSLFPEEYKALRTGVCIRLNISYTDLLRPVVNIARSSNVCLSILKLISQF